MGPISLAFLTTLSLQPSPMRDATERSEVLVLARKAERFSGVASLSELIAVTEAVLESQTFTKAVSVPGEVVRLCYREDTAKGLPFCQVEEALKLSPAQHLLFVLTGRSKEGEWVRLGYAPLADIEPIVDSTKDAASDLSRLLKSDLYNEATSELLAQIRLSPRITLGTKGVSNGLKEALHASELSTPFASLMARHQTRLEVEVEPEAQLARLAGPELLSGALEGSATTWTLLGVPPGTYQLEAKRDGYYPSQAHLDVNEGQATQVFLQLDPDHSLGWTVMTWTGAALLGAGAAVGVWGLTEEASRPPGLSEDPLRWASGGGSNPFDRGTSGPLIFGVSAGLATTGTSMLVAGLLKERPTEHPWWAVALSVAGGLAMYGAFELGAAL